MARSKANKFLIDGFPREVHQAEVFEREVKEPKLVVFYDCPEVRLCFLSFANAAESGTDQSQPFLKQC